MDNVTDKTKKLIEVIDRSEIIKELDYYKNKVVNNNELMSMIDKYKLLEDEYEKLSLKKRIYEYEDYNLYMKYYNELFYVVMKINNMYKRFISDRGCM